MGFSCNMSEDEEGWMEGIPKHGKKGSYSFILPLVNVELLAFPGFTFFCTCIQSHRTWEYRQAQIHPVL